MNYSVKKALRAKNLGYAYLATVVKSVYRTTYYNVVSVDVIIKAGRWLPAPKGQFTSGAHGRHGTSNVDWTKTIRRDSHKLI